MRLLSDSELIQLYNDSVGTISYSNEVSFTEDTMLYLESWIQTEIASGNLYADENGSLYVTGESYGTFN